MLQFDNVSIVKKANVYFDGKVTSRSVLFESGEKKTLGIMLPGEYEFSTADKELMEILGGKLDVMVKGATEYTTYTTGMSFEVEKNSSFKLIVKEVCDYCCSYIKE